MTEKQATMWCIDTGEKTAYQYRGPWDMEETAREWLAVHGVEYPEAVIRRCRAISPVGMINADHIEEMWAEQAVDNPGERVWANWEDALVVLRDPEEARRAFDEWCRKYLQPKIYMCED